MRIQDLMVGDIVSVNGWPAKVTNIVTNDETDDEVLLLVREAKYAEHEEYYASSIEPLPITPDFLKRNGFTITERDTWFERYTAFWFKDKVVNAKAEFTYYVRSIGTDTLFKCWRKPESRDVENDIHICDLKYIHELQHAMKLCGINKDFTV